MPTFSIDNDRVAPNTQDLTLDQSAGVQTPSTDDTGNDIDPTISLDGSNELDGLDSDFETFLSGLGLTQDQKDFAVNTDGAASNADFIQVTPEGGETINDLKFVADSSTAVSGLTTVDGGDALYLHVDATGNYATLTTAADGSGRIVAAFALTDEAVDGSGVWTAGVQMVTFEALNHSDGGDPDDTVPLTDALKIAVDTAVSFNFDQLKSGNFLWAAVGDSDSAMLITGQDLNVKDSGSASHIGDILNSGATDPSDSVNTSQAAPGSEATIGINAQHFAAGNSADGATGVLTFVTGYQPLDSATPTYAGINVKQIQYQDYINVSSASINISQLTGGSSAKIHLSLWEAGGAGSDKAPGDLIPEEGYTNVSGVSESYIGNQDSDSHLTDDTAVNVASVTIGGNTWLYNEANITTGVTKGGITVSIDGNDIIVNGAHAGDTIAFTALDDAGSAVDGTFNRVDLQALQGSAAFDIGHIDLSSGGLTSVGIGDHMFFDDDGPTIDPSNDVGQPNDLEVANKLFTDDPTGGDSSFYILGHSTDGDSFTIINPDSLDYTEDSTGKFRWTYDDDSHTAITGTFRDSNNVDHDLYTLVVNQDGTYEFKMIGTLPDKSEQLSSTIIHAGGPVDTVDVLAKAPSTDFARIVADDGTNNPLVNASHGFVGVDNGNLDNGESLTLSLHKANGDLIEVSGITIGTKSAGTCHYDVFVTINGVETQVSDNLEVLKNGIIAVNDPDPNDNELIESIRIVKVDGNAIKIGLGNINFLLPPDDIQLPFAVQIADGDTDAQHASFTVDIDGNNDGNFDATVNSAAVTLNSALALSSMDALGRHAMPSSQSVASDGPSEVASFETVHHQLLAADHLMHV